MKYYFTFLFLILALSFAVAQQQPSSGDNQISIIPQPLSIQTQSGEYKITNSTKIYIDNGNTELRKIGEMLSSQLKSQTGKILNIVEYQTLPSKNAIILTLKNTIDTLGDEGYSLSVNPNNIVIKANNPKGVFYGMQTLLQLIPLKNGSVYVAIPAVNILDKPRFGWRGLMLDVGRYFYSVDFLKKYFDYMAMHKLNTFHWHLTEDHGWRIEIKKYPKLTEVGAWREGTQIDRNPKNIDNNPHGGYYTQDQVREIVAYAKDRYITIVPEIEMPGHSLAALVAYPELSCTGGPFKMPVAWAIQKDVYCAGNEQTYKFLEDILSEIADLFPGQIIHIGGDECPKDRWKECPKCQAKIKAEGLKDEHELQSYFIKRIENFLLTKNKRIIGWDEILEGGLAPNAAVMSWRGVDGGISAAKQHHDVVMTPTSYTYFDYYQGEPYLEPIAIGGFLPLEKVYSYEPIPAELSKEEVSYIKGVQANVWSEFIHSPEKVEYMTFPRAAALAEIAWTKPELKNWDDFKQRMEKQYQRYENAGINCAKSAYDVKHLVVIDPVTGKKASVTLSTSSFHPEIRYTTDGTEPTAQSKKYSDSFTVNLPGTVKAATFKNGKRISQVSVESILPTLK